MFKKFLKIFNFWNFPREVITEIQEWRLVNKALKEPATIEALKACELDKPSELRVNKIGEIYTIINVPEDIFMSKTGIWPYVMEKMNIVNETMIKCRLSDLVYPAIEQVPNTQSWLLTLSAKREYLRPKKIILELIRWIFLLVLIKVGFGVMESFGIDVLGLISTYFNKLVSLIW